METVKTLSALRRLFWDQHPEHAEHYKPRKRQNEYPADVRMAWVDFVDYANKEGIISRNLAQRATL